MGTRRKTIGIRNREVRMLLEVKDIMAEIHSLEIRQQWERERLTHITRQIGSAPGGGGRNGLDDAFARLEELENRHRERIAAYTGKIQQAEDILSGISNKRMRVFCRLMYLDQAKTEEVQQQLCLSRRQFERCRQSIEEAAEMAAVDW